jgi:hypothetical protein
MAAYYFALPFWATCNFGKKLKIYEESLERMDSMFSSKRGILVETMSQIIVWSTLSYP